MWILRDRDRTKPPRSVVYESIKAAIMIAGVIAAVQYAPDMAFLMNIQLMKRLI